MQGKGGRLSPSLTFLRALPIPPQLPINTGSDVASKRSGKDMISGYIQLAE